MASVVYNIKGTYDDKAAKQATTGINGLAGKISETTKSIKNSFAGLNNLSKSFNSFSKAAPGIGLIAYGFNRVTAAVKGTIAKMKEWESVWKENDLAARRVDFAATINGKLGTTSAVIKKWAVKLSSDIKGYFQEGDILGAIKSILYDKTASQIKQITEAAVDLAAATGVDLNTAVKQLAATYKGETGELANTFTSLKTLTAEELKAGKAVEIVAAKVKGAAVEMSKTTEGSLRAAQDAGDSLKSELGAIFTQSMTPMRNFFTELKQGWADALRKKREYKEEKTAVANGSATSTQYADAVKSENRIIQLKTDRSYSLDSQYRTLAAKTSNTDNYGSWGKFSSEYQADTAKMKEIRQELDKLLPEIEEEKKKRAEYQKSYDETSRKEKTARDSAVQEQAAADKAEKDASEAKARADMEMALEIQRIKNQMATGTITEQEGNSRLRRLTNTNYLKADEIIRDPNTSAEYKQIAEALKKAAETGMKQEDSKDAKAYAASLGDIIAESFKPAQKALYDFDQSNRELLEALKKKIEGGTATEDEKDAYTSMGKSRETLVTADEAEKAGVDTDKYTAWKGFTSGLSKTFNALKTTGEETGSSLKSSFSDAAAGIRSAVSSVSSYLGEFGTAMKALITGNPLGLIIAIISAFASMMLGIENFGKVINFISTIFERVGQVIEPLVNQVFQPVVTFLEYIGDILGQILLPIFSAIGQVLEPVFNVLNTLMAAITPIITVIGQLATLFMQLSPVMLLFNAAMNLISNTIATVFNNVIRPVLNFCITILTGFVNIFIGAWNGVVDVLKKISLPTGISISLRHGVKVKWKSLASMMGLSEMDYVDADDYKLDEINAASSSSSSAAAGGTGSSASYTAAKDVYVNIYFDHSFVNGDAREIALMLRDTLEDATKLGA